MMNRKVMPLMVLGVCGAVWLGAPALAALEHRYATQINVVTGWNYETQAENSPNCSANCKMSSCAANAPTGYTAYLVVQETGFTDDPGWFRCKRITNVYINYKGAWGSGSGTLMMRVTGGGYADEYRAVNATQNCGWVFADAGWRLTAPPTGWTQDVVRGLKPAIRRASASTPNSPFWLDAIRITVEWEPDPAAPSNCQATPGTINPGGCVQLSGTVETGATIDWYAGSCNGTFVGSGNPLTVCPTTTTSYYGKARNSQGCVSTTCCGPVAVQVVPLPPPDLTVDNVAASPASPLVGQTVTITARIRNIGASASPPTSAALVRNSSNQPSSACSYNDGLASVPALPPNGSTTVQFSTVYPTSGSHKTWISIDPCNAVTEGAPGGETNNWAFVNVPVSPAPPGPEWSIEGITLVPSNPAAGQMVQVRITVRNNGGAAPATHVGIWRNSPGCPPGGCQPDFLVPVPALAQGATTQVVKDIGSYAAGAYLLCACVDPCNQVAEPNESNNCHAQPISIGTGANLVIESMSATPAAPMVNQQVTLAFTVRNTGTEASGSTSVAVKWDSATAPGCSGADDYLNIPALGPGAAVTMQVTRSYSSSGSKTAWVCADPCGVVPESNESDNCRNLPIPVGSPPTTVDLVVTSITYVPLNPSVNQQIEVTAVVRNGGTASSGPFWVTLVKHSPGIPASRCPGDAPPQRVNGLGVNMTAVVRFTISYGTYGNKRLWVCVDGCDEVNETPVAIAEANNCRSRDIYVRSSVQLGEIPDDRSEHEVDGQQAEQLEIEPAMTDGGEFGPSLRGDLNCDGRIDLGDVDPFILALGSPDEYWERFSNCDVMLADCNGDGALDLADIDWFVALITEQ